MSEVDVFASEDEEDGEVDGMGQEEHEDVVDHGKNKKRKVRKWDEESEQTDDMSDIEEVY
jgi:hypothetical protein